MEDTRQLTDRQFAFDRAISYLKYDPQKGYALADALQVAEVILTFLEADEYTEVP